MNLLKSIFILGCVTLLISGCGYNNLDDKNLTFGDEHIKIDYLEVDRTYNSKNEIYSITDSQKIDQLITLFNNTDIQKEENAPKLEPENYCILKFNDNERISIITDAINEKVYFTFKRNNTETDCYNDYSVDPTFLEQLEIPLCYDKQN